MWTLDFTEITQGFKTVLKSVLLLEHEKDIFLNFGQFWIVELFLKV